MRRSYLRFFVLFLVIFSAFFLRFHKLGENPPSLNWDEVSIGYNAYSILETGRDEWGKLFPIHFKSYGEYKLPAQVYFSIPAISIFGVNEFGVRITPVIYGTLTVLIVFFLGRKLFGSTIVGLGAAILLAISPWHIQLTRASFESSFAVFWVTLGIWLLVKGFENREWWYYSMIPFAISVFTYNSARIFTPLFLLAALFIFRNTLSKLKKEVLLSVILFTVLLLPLTPYLLSGERSARYKLVSVTDDPGLIPRINENRGNSNLPLFLPRLIHNKVTYITYYVGRNYLAHFTPEFLFISGAPHKQHHVQGVGQLYIFQAPLLIIGLVALFYKKTKFRWLLLSWPLIAFIPVSVTNDSIPHALRTLIAVPFYQLVSAFGGYQLYLWLRYRHRVLRVVIYTLFLLLVFQNIATYLHYYNMYPNLYSRDWQYGYKQAVDYINNHYDEYDLIVLTRHFGEPHMFTLFYLRYPPDKYQNDPNLVRFETYDWVRVLYFDKFHFPDLGDEGTRYQDIVSENVGKKILFIGKIGDFPEDVARLKTIDFLNGNRAFEIVEHK